MSLSLYETALTEPGSAVRLRHADGRVDALEVGRWSAPPDEADTELLRRLTGPVLDIGCGPGRLGAALAARGVHALGLDVSTAAVRLARERGGTAVRCDVFGAVPAAGAWHDVLLIDGNVGIGGSPHRLLSRTRELMAAGGTVHVEVGPPGTARRDGTVRLEQGRAHTGSWFPWSWVGIDDIAGVAEPLGLEVADFWWRGPRWFAELRA